MLVNNLLMVVVCAVLLLPSTGAAHGGVVEEDDLCVINIGYLKAHFKIYVPAARQHEQFCEDIPIRGESIFVMEYVHEGLSQAEIDFRIIENVTGKGTFARLEDVREIPDLDAVTVRYEPPRVVPDVYTLLQPFAADGEYIGIVSATNELDGRVHTAVFPFEVGFTGTGYWPWVAAAIILLQINYWYMSRRRQRRAAPVVLLLAATVCTMPDAGASDAPPLASRDGYFLVRYSSELDPLVINRLHAWTLVITTADGEPVTGASIDVSGGMPEHDHGLPTTPIVAAADDNGTYRLRGLRFHMGGAWEMVIEIDDGLHRDRVVVSVMVEAG